MQLLLDFPTIGEPHYAQACPAELITKHEVKFFKLDSNTHKYAAKNEKEAKVVRNGNDVHVYATAIRSHFTPDNIEGVKVGDNVYFHVTNLEQDWDVPHGFCKKGANNSELLVLPGETATLNGCLTRPGVLSYVLHRFLFGITPGDARICARIAGRNQYRTQVFYWRIG
jgi:nitrous-oxide reductase